MLQGYKQLQNGVIYQEDLLCTMDYTEGYITSSYGEEEMLNISYLRLGFLISFLESVGKKGKIEILDVGYGFGHFLKVCSDYKFNAYGIDINNHDISKFAKIGSYSGYYDVVTFYDSLEHFHSIDFIKDLNCKYILISMPLCHYFGDAWFRDWKHRKYGEHLWHFSEEALVNHLKDCGYIVRLISNVEDSLRVSSLPYRNIQTIIAEKVI